jgi:hypothetical protein
MRVGGHTSVQAVCITEGHWDKLQFLQFCVTLDSLHDRRSTLGAPAYRKHARVDSLL